MRTIRYWIRFLKAFLSRFKRLILGSIVLGILIFIYISRFGNTLSVFKGGETTGVIGRLSLEELPSSIQKELSTGLTSLDKEGRPIPSLAQSWETLDVGRVWIFKLKESKWQDGTEIRAEDINYRFRDATKETIDEKTIKFTLKDPFAPFPNVVSRPVFKKGLLGAGDWKVAKLTQLTAQFNRSLTLVNSKTGQKKTYRFYDTEDAARTAYKLGQITKLSGLVDPKDLLKWKNSEFDVESHQERYVGVFLNVQDPTLSGKSVRQALAYAINKDNFEEERAISVISPNSWAFNPQVKEYKYSKERAKELLNTLPQDQRTPTINLATTPGLLTVADQIKKDWEAVGIKTNLQVSNTPSQNFQALLAIQIIPTDPDQYSLWHSTQSATNVTGYTNGECCKESPRIDKLLENGRRTLDQEQRKEFYYDFQRFLLEDLPVIPLFHPVTYTITRK
ncbi:MAG: ABC transporter substrate-binding protein [Patescibacteria group bacterium]